jgi:hypothetical protein
MTIDQTEVILTAFEREIAKCLNNLIRLEKEQGFTGCRNPFLLEEEKLKMATWKRAAAIVSRFAGEVKP